MSTKAIHIQQKEVIAIDYSALFSMLAHPIASQEAFAAAWDASQTEAMHFTAAKLSDSEGYVDSMVIQLLEVAAAYLHLDPWQSPDALGFGLFLCSYLYFTQPSTMVVATPSSPSTTAEAAAAASPTAAASSATTTTLCRRHQVKIGLDAYHTLLVRLPALPNCDLLRSVLASLVACEAIDVCPFVNNGPSIAAIVTAHSLFGTPLIDLQRLKRETQAIAAKNRADLDAIEARINGGGAAPTSSAPSTAAMLEEMRVGSSSSAAPASRNTNASNDEDDDIDSALFAALGTTGGAPAASATASSATAALSAAMTSAAFTAAPHLQPDYGTDAAAMHSIAVLKDKYLQMRKGLLK